MDPIPVLTLFSSPKPFSDPHIAMIQRNAILSWKQLPQAEIILLGNEAGVAKAARDLHTKHLAQVECNRNGTPLISSMIQLARSNSSSPFLCLINTDIIIFQDLLESLNEVRKAREKFILLSQRWDLSITKPIDYSKGATEKLRKQAEREGVLHKPAGSDYFIFPRDCYEQIPPFAVGRSGWDNWMIYEARREGWPVIDCTPSALVIHQAHDYSHLPGGKAHHTAPETDENIRLAGGQAAIRYTLLDSTHLLIDGKLARPPLTGGRFARKVELILRSMLAFLPEDRIENLARPKRWKKRIQKLFRSDKT